MPPSRLFLLRLLIFVITASSLLLIGINAQKHLTQKNVDAIILSSGQVAFIHQHSQFHVGDKVILADSIPYGEIEFPNSYQDSNITEITFTIDRNNTLQEIVVPFGNPPLWPVLSLELALVLISLVFWLTGVSVGYFHVGSNWSVAIVFILFMQTAALIFASLYIHTQHWTSTIPAMMLWFITPLNVHLHLLFPLNRFNRGWRNLLTGAYIFATFGFFIDVLRRLSEFFASQPFLQYWSDIWLFAWLLIGLGGSITLLIYSYSHASSPSTQRQVGVVAASGIIAPLPVITFSLVPNILLGTPLLPYQLMLVTMIVLPLGYGFAIRQYAFIRLEQYLNRTMTLFTTVTIVSIIYWGLLSLSNNLLPSTWRDLPLIDFLIVITLALSFGFFRTTFSRFFDRLLYGGWYDYSSVVNRVFRSLKQASNLDNFALSLNQTLQTTMRVRWVGMLIIDEKGQINTISVVGDTESVAWFEGLEHDQESSLIEALATQTLTIPRYQLFQVVNLTQFANSSLLHQEYAQLFVPIQAKKGSGLLILGNKYGGDDFDDSDLNILNAISWYASTALKNAQLVYELEQKVEEVERYQRLATAAREAERKRLALELHDRIIQSLAGFKYQIADMQAQLDIHPISVSMNQRAYDLQERLGELIQISRNICFNLRPPALDLGVVPSLRSVINRFEMENEILTAFQIEGDRNVTIHEDVALCLLRCTQEALTNIRKYASATQIDIHLQLTPQCIYLQIEDNGKGFVLPERLGTLMDANHFGIVGMRERVELVKGVFQINSSIAEGTTINIDVPLE